MTATLIRLEEIPRLDIDTIDSQHETIVKLVNELHAAMLGNRGREALGKLLIELVEETQGHFASEEALMLANNYPAYAQHKTDHDKLIAHVVDLERQFRDGDCLLSFAIMLDLKNWATIHIERSDISLGEFLKAKGIR